MNYDVVKRLIDRDECFLKKDALIVFVCGKSIERPDSNRRIFVEYVKRHVTGFHFLLAEDLFLACGGRNTDLLSMEEQLAKYSDAIIIILESESAYAELGAFSIIDDLAKIIIPINNKKYSKENSFINFGPIEKINNITDGLGPVVQASMDSFSHCIPDIFSRLEKIKKHKRQRLLFSAYEDFISYNKIRMLFVFDVICLYSPMKKKELFELLSCIYGYNNFNVVKFDVDMLAALGFIRVVNEYCVAMISGPVFIDFPISDLIKIKSDALICYEKDRSDRLLLLKDRRLSRGKSL